MAEIRLPYQWDPRPYQRSLWRYLNAGGKRAVAVWHRRAGKDEVCLHHTACAAHERVGNYWHMLPEYAQARKAIWDAINGHTGKKRIDEAFPEALRASTNDQEMKIKFQNGSTWQVVGSDNVNSLVGSAVVGMVFSEYALSNPSSWGYLSPILMENDGWALFISTPRGHNHFEAMLKTAQREDGWFAEVLTADQTGVFTPEQLESEKRQLCDLHGDDYGASLWLQEYFASFDAAIPGAIWGDCLDRAQQEGRILDFAIDTTRPVDTAFDLGRTDDTAIWFRQMAGQEIRLIDHHSSNGKDVQFYVDLLLAKAEQHGITYGTHYLPHDARPRTLAAGGKSILQQFHDAAQANPALGRFVIGKRLDVQEGIMAARKTFPYCRFHATRCAKGLASLRQYHRQWDDEKKMFAVAPAHDWASHDSDAFRYLSLSWKRQDPQREDSPLMDRMLASTPGRMTFGQLKQAHFRTKQRQRELAS